MKSTTVGTGLVVMLLAITAGAAVPAPAAPPSGRQEPQKTAKPAARLPVPESEKLLEVEKFIRDRFKSDYARSSATDRRALAEKLLAYAQKEADPASRFVLLREARDLASQMGDLNFSIAAVDELGKSYDLDPIEMAASVLANAAKSLRSSAQSASFAEVSLLVAERAVSTDEYDVAAGLLAKAEAAAKNSQNPPLLAQMQARSREVGELRKEYQRTKSAEKVLIEKPDDAPSNLMTGRFYCFIKRDWERGVPRLAKGNDAALKGAAERELAAPADVLGQISAGDGWWDWAEKQSAQLRPRAQERALMWYERAWPQAAGATRARLRDRFRLALARPDTAKVAKSTDLPAPWACGLKEVCALDNRYSHTGISSVRIAHPSPPKAEKALIILQHPTLPAQPGEHYNFSGWAMTDNTSANGGVLYVISLGADGIETARGRGSAMLPADQPWWSHVQGTFTCPPGTTGLIFRLEMTSPEGAVWLDDVSLHRAGEERELLQNSSFEPRK